MAISVKYPMILGRFRNGLLSLPLYLRKPIFLPHRDYPTWFLFFFSPIVTPEKTGPLRRLRHTAPESHKPFNLQCLEDQRTKYPLLFGPLKLKAWNILFFCHICFLTIQLELLQWGRRMSLKMLILNFTCGLSSTYKENLSLSVAFFSFLLY